MAAALQPALARGLAGLGWSIPAARKGGTAEVAHNRSIRFLAKPPTPITHSGWSRATVSARARSQASKSGCASAAGSLSGVMFAPFSSIKISGQ